MDLGDTSKTIATEAWSWSQLLHSILSDTRSSDMEHAFQVTEKPKLSKSYEYKLGTKNIQAGMGSGMHSQVEQAHEHEKQQGIEHIQDCTRSSKYFEVVQVNVDGPGIEHIQDCVRSIKLHDVVQVTEDQQDIEHIQDCMRSIKLHDVVGLNEDQQGIEHIQDCMRSVKLHDVVQVNEDQQEIKYIQDCIRSSKLHDVVQANEEIKQGIEHIQYCMRSNKHYELLQANEHENQQGNEHIHERVISALHYQGVQEHGHGNQQGMEHIQDNIRLPLLSKPREYEEHQLINNFLETAESSSSDDSDALEELNYENQQWVQAQLMSRWIDELLDLVENRDLKGDGKIFLFQEVGSLIELLHQHGVDTIRRGVAEELENLNQKHVHIEKDEEMHYKKKGLEVMLRICNTEMCEETIYEIMSKAEKGQVFCY